MRTILFAAGALLSGLSPLAAASSEPSEDFQFFAQEARVITASRIYDTIRRSPATVRVVTAQEIKDSGARNIWEALRSLPGVDVIQTKANQGEVSIRGLNQPNNTRTLVLLDGRKQLNPFTDYMTWAAMPVTLQQVERIEVVQGPSSVIYGANAVNGVINIITRGPEKYNGLEGAAAYSERGGRAYSADYGRQSDSWGYRFGGGLERVNGFERADRLSSRAGNFSFDAAYKPGGDREAAFSGGVAGHNVHVSAYESIGDFFNQGRNGFLEASWRDGGASYKANWSYYAMNFADSPELGDVAMRSNEFGLETSRTFSLPAGHEAALGASYRHSSSRSNLADSLGGEDYWALTAEDRWDMSPAWMLHAGARLDKQPHIDETLSSRASLIFTPARSHVLRLSAGTAFRAPTQLQNHVETTLTLPNGPTSGVPYPGYTTLHLNMRPNTGITPEKYRSAELAYSRVADWGEASVTGFYYRLRKLIHATQPAVTDLSAPPDAYMEGTYTSDGTLQAWGGELAASAKLTGWLTSYANYSCQIMKGLVGLDARVLAGQSPRNKVNAGLRARNRGWTWDLNGHWADKTRWTATTDYFVIRTVPSYILVNAAAGYTFGGRLGGLQAGLSVFNLFNKEHYETLPQQDAVSLGQSGEIVRQRWTASLSYQF